MGAFKNKDNGTWIVQFRYVDWRGENKQVFKRGFATKKEAQEYEREFRMQKSADVTMNFGTFVELYEKDIRPSLKENTWLTKEHIIKEKILPYFSKKRLCDIAAKDVIAWQNEMRNATSKGGKKLSQTYLKTIHLMKFGKETIKMSAKNLDNHKRWRNITVGFRVSAEENELINKAVKLSGLPKQEYCYRRCLGQDIVVQGNPRVYEEN